MRRVSLVVFYIVAALLLPAFGNGIHPSPDIEARRINLRRYTSDGDGCVIYYYITFGKLFPYFSSQFVFGFTSFLIPNRRTKNEFLTLKERSNSYILLVSNAE